MAASAASRLSVVVLPSCFTQAEAVPEPGLARQAAAVAPQLAETSAGGMVGLALTPVVLMAAAAAALEGIQAMVARVEAPERAAGQGLEALLEVDAEVSLLMATEAALAEEGLACMGRVPLERRMARQLASEVAQEAQEATGAALPSTVAAALAVNTVAAAAAGPLAQTADRALAAL